MTKLQQGNLVELEITDLSSSGEGIGRLDGQVVFVPNTVTGDRALVRLVRVKSQYSYGKLEKILHQSEYRIRPRCIVADVCGGCQWQHISDEYQRLAKRQQVIAALERIGGFSEVVVNNVIAESSLNYRNKATYPLGISATKAAIAGYYRANTHQLINLNQCPVQDSRLNPILAEVKADIQKNGWSIYDEKKHTGQLRHLSLRIGRRTGEILLTLIVTDWNLKAIAQQADIWLKRYPTLVGVCLNYQPQRGNVIFGEETRTIAGRGYLVEIFDGLEFRLRPETFFQVNTETAEALLAIITEQLQLQGNEVLIDAYCGIGTFTLPLARRVGQALGIEVQVSSVEQARINATINQVNNVNFYAGTTETVLPQLEVQADIVVLDPPRKGCEKKTLDTLISNRPPRIVYISCQSATLARDLKILCENGGYKLISVHPADFFPQTSHIECAAFLQQ